MRHTIFGDVMTRLKELRRERGYTQIKMQMLTGIDHIESHLSEASGQLRQKGVKNILVTLGEKGVYVDSEETGICQIPAIPVDAIDTTAAGDSFTAALAVMLAEGKSLQEAAVFANYVSAIVVTRKGAQSSIPTLQEVQQYIQHIEAEKAN